MNTVLWILQIILGIKLLSVSYTHGLRQSQPTMQDAIRRMGRLGVSLHYAVAISTFAAAIGLILPGVLQSQSRMLYGTAVFVSLLLLASIFFHVRSREKPNVFASVILFAFAAFVAYGRWILTP
jgi:hypothetical protein